MRLVASRFSVRQEAKREELEMYGLILPKKLLQKNVAGPKHSAFADDSDEETSVGESLQKESLKKRVMKQTKLEIQKALEEDSTVYEYDNVYDDMQKKKEEENEAKLMASKERKPKYIQNLLKAVEVRKKEQEKRMEKKIQKEREMEGEEFQDKEAFVTSAYKKRLQEKADEEERERREAALEASLDVTKQKDLSGFYRHLLNQTVGEEDMPECSLRDAGGNDHIQADYRIPPSKPRILPKEHDYITMTMKEQTSGNSDEPRREMCNDEKKISGGSANMEDNIDADSDLGSESSEEDATPEKKKEATPEKKKEATPEKKKEASKSKTDHKKEYNSKKQYRQRHSSSSSEEMDSHKHQKKKEKEPSNESRSERDRYQKEQDYYPREKKGEHEERHRHREHKDRHRNRDEQDHRVRDRDRKETENSYRESRRGDNVDKHRQRHEKDDRYGEHERDRGKNYKDAEDEGRRRDRIEKHREERSDRQDKDKKQKDKEKRSPSVSDRRAKEHSERQEPKRKDEEETPKENSSSSTSKFAKRSNVETVVSARDRYLARQMSRAGTKAHVEKEED